MPFYKKNDFFVNVLLNLFLHVGSWQIKQILVTQLQIIVIK